MIGPVRYVRASFFWKARAVYRPIRVCCGVSAFSGGVEVLEGLIMNLMDHGPDVSLYQISYLAVESGSAWEIHHFVFVWLSCVCIVSGERSMLGLSSSCMDSWLIGMSSLSRHRGLGAGVGSSVMQESGMVGVWSFASGRVAVGR